MWSCTLCLQESSSVGDILSKKSLTAVSAAAILEKNTIVLHGTCLWLKGAFWIFSLAPLSKKQTTTKQRQTKQRQLQ